MDQNKKEDSNMQVKINSDITEKEKVDAIAIVSTDNGFISASSASAQSNKIIREEDLNSAKKDFEDKVREVNLELKETKISVIESLGLFVAIFTFISIDFQVFRSYRDPEAISGLTLILLGSIGFLMSIFDVFIFHYLNITKESVNENNQIIIKVTEKFRFDFIRMTFFVIEIILIVMGYNLFINSKSESFEDESKRIEDKLNQNINTRLDNNVDLQNIIQESRESKRILDCLKYKGQYSESCF